MTDEMIWSFQKYGINIQLIAFQLVLSNIK